MREHGFNMERLKRESGVAKSTLHHWLNGSVKRPYGWENLLRVAIALHLTKARTNRLLCAADLAPLDHLAAGASTSEQRLLLQHWGL